MEKVKQKKSLIIGLLLLILAGIGIWYTQNQQLSQQKAIKDEQTAELKKKAVQEVDKKEEDHEHKPGDVLIVSGIAEDGYAWLHGDHSHFVNGKVPYDAKFVDELVYKDPNYVLRKEDIQYEVAEGYIIKIGKKFYYYPKPKAKQTHIVTREEGERISKAQDKGKSYHEDGYVFNPADIVERTADGVVVRHGDHFHYIRYSELSAADRKLLGGHQSNQGQGKKPTSVVEVGAKQPGPADSAAGITKPTDDGFVFDGTGIVSRTDSGLVVQHGDHTHFIFYSQLVGTKWAYLIPKPNRPQPVETTPSLPEPVDPIAVKPKPEKDIPGITKPTDDGFLFDGTGIVSRTPAGLVVQHGDHNHFIFYSQLIGTKWEYLIPKENQPIEKPKPDKPAPDKPTPDKPAPEQPIAPKPGDGEVEPVEPKPEPGEPKPDPEENRPDEEVTLEEKIAYLAKHFNVKPEDIKVDGDYLIVPHGDHTHAYPIADIDPSKPFEDPHGDPHAHQKTGIETLKAMGFDEEVIHALLHAEADKPFPSKETNVEKMTAWLHGVRSINIGEMENPLKRKGLEHLTGLRLLAVGYTPIDDITPIKQFKELRHLWIPRTGIKDFTFLDEIPHLEGLDLSQLDLKSIDFLAKYPNLTSISAAGNQLTNIDVLANMPQLQTLNFDYNAISDLTPIKDAQQLKAISFEHNHIKDLKALNNKPQLVKLFIGDNEGAQLADITSNSLEAVIADHIALGDLNFLDQMPNLKQLSVKNNQLTSLAGVEKVKKLDVLFADHNQIAHLDGVSDSLTVLTVNHNAITDMSGISNYTALTNLEASNNQIPALLGSSDTLTTLKLNDNALTSLEGINQYKLLESLEVNGNFIKTMDILEMNHTIEYMDIANNPLGELTATDTPAGLDKFENLKYGGYLPSYTLDEAYLLNIVNDLNRTLKNNTHRFTEEERQGFEAKIQTIEADLKAHQNDDALYRKAKRELAALDEEMANLIDKAIEAEYAAGDDEEDEDEVIDSDGNEDSEQPDPAADSANKEKDEAKEDATDDKAGDEESPVAKEKDSTTAEDGFVFDPENVVSENHLGFVVSHGDHYHFVFAKDLTPEQIQKSREVIARKSKEKEEKEKPTADKPTNADKEKIGEDEDNDKVKEEKLLSDPVVSEPDLTDKEAA